MGFGVSVFTNCQRRDYSTVNFALSILPGFVYNRRRIFWIAEGGMPEMKYIQVDINVKREGIEPAVSALLGVGITDTVVEDPADIEDPGV